ncbi:MAG: hypothetical protein LBI64_00930 [Coriobacteriales bacterium]|jgi:hypothetical protein|nr:hypothetical protein [Coriobacteriales bacterium]
MIAILGVTEIIADEGIPCRVIMGMIGNLRASCRTFARRSTNAVPVEARANESRKDIS